MLSAALCLLLALSAAPALAIADPSDSTKAVRIADSLRSYRANQVVVTGTRNEVRLKDSPVRVEVIGADRIKTTAMVNLGDLLKEQTGLQLTGTVRTGLQMNGLGADYTMILIDGQPMVGRVAGVLDMSRISVGNIERVEVVKGPMSSMYGSEALAGVVNIITKRPPDGWSARTSAQATQRGPLDLQVETGWASDSLELSAFVNAKTAEGFSLRTSNPSDPLEASEVPFAGFRDATGHAKLLWRLPGGWKARASMRAFGSETRGRFVESVFGQVAQNEGAVTQLDVSGSAGMEYMHGHARLQTTAYVTHFGERYNFDVDQGNAGRIDDMSRRLARLYTQYDLFFDQSSSFPMNSGRLTMGAELLYDDIGGTRFVDSTATARPFYRTGVGFVQWEGQPIDQLSYVLSGRIDANNVFGHAWSPRFSLLWKPSFHVRVGSSVGRGFKAPDFRQLFLAFSNRLPGANYDLIGAARLGIDLQPETSTSYDLSVRFEDGVHEVSSAIIMQWNAEVRAFRNDIANLIDFYLAGRVDDRAVYSYRNIARAYTQGAELNVNVAALTDALGSISLQAGYQFLDAADVEVLRAIDAGTAGTISTPLTRDAYQGLWGRSRHSGTMRLQWDSPSKSTSANVRWQFVGRFGDEALDKNGFVMSDPTRRVLDRDDEFVPGYTVLNLAATHTFTIGDSSALTIGAGVNNLLDIANPTLIPGLVGRQWFVQSSWRL